MRITSIFLCLVVLAGCSGIGGLAPRSGIGNNIYAPDTSREIALQDAYAGLLCASNGLPVVIAAQGGVTRCDYNRLGAREWSIFVDAGMYDIDRRCDAYLDWLYQAKRNRQPFGQQLAKTATLADAVLELTGVGDLTISLAALAFGYAQDTFTNFNSSLIFEIESSTVQAIVLSRQTQAKIDIHALSVSTKPQAMHALRAYLRICMPYTIETDINSTLAGNARGSIINTPIIDTSAAVFGARTATTAVVIPVEGDFNPGPDVNVSRMFSVPSGKTRDDVKDVQSVLCVANADGLWGDKTEAAILVYEDWSDQGPNDTKIDPNEQNELLGLGTTCPSSIYRNVFEWRMLGDGAVLTAVLEALNKRNPSDPLPLTGFDTDGFPRDKFRRFIAEYRQAANVPISPLVPTDQLTRVLYNKLLQDFPPG